MGKNAKRKKERAELRAKGISPQAINSNVSKFGVLAKVADLWGKELHTRSEVHVSTDGVSTHELYVWFGNIPYVVLGIKGVGDDPGQAEKNVAWNFVSFLINGYCDRKTYDIIRSNWSYTPEADLAEVVKVCRLFDTVINQKEFSKLLNTTDDSSDSDRSLAKKVRQLVRTRILDESAKRIKDADPEDDKSVISTVFSPQTQLAKAGQKRKGGSPDDTDGSEAKKGRMNEIVELSDSSDSDSVILEESVIHQVNETSVSLNVKGIENYAEDSEVKFLQKDMFGGHNTFEDFCASRNLPVHYEHALLGVEYNGCFSRERSIQDRLRRFPKDVQKLSDDIWDHFQTSGQTADVYATKMRVKAALEEEFRRILREPNIALYAVGSTVNGCGSYNSDMDLCLCLPSVRGYEQDRSHALQVLRRIRRELFHYRSQVKHLVRNCHLIAAKVPIVKMDLHAPYEDLDLDVNVNNLPGIYNSHLIHYYSQCDPRFSALCLLIKHWAIRNEISDAMTGTFNSYSLILLVLHYLQCGVRPAVLPNLQYLFPQRFANMPPLETISRQDDIVSLLPTRVPNVSNVGELLIGFFEYYDSFDFSSFAISIRNAKIFPRNEMPYDTQHFQLYIEEPFDGKNTARCVTKLHCMEQIQQAISDAKQALLRHPNVRNIGVII